MTVGASDDRSVRHCSSRRLMFTSTFAASNCCTSCTNNSSRSYSCKLASKIIFLNPFRIRDLHMLTNAVPDPVTNTLACCSREKRKRGRSAKCSMKSIWDRKADRTGGGRAIASSTLPITISLSMRESKSRLTHSCWPGAKRLQRSRTVRSPIRHGASRETNS